MVGLFLSHFLSICLVLYVVLETELQASDHAERMRYC